MAGQISMLDLPGADIPASLKTRGIDRAVVWATPMKMRFRRIDVREGLLLHGPQGWGEVSPFWDYDPVESATWLRAGCELATVPLPTPKRREILVNVTVPVCSPEVAYRRVLDSGCRTAKVKVADPGYTLAEDCARVSAVRDALDDAQRDTPGVQGRGQGQGQIRVDANQAWDEDAAVVAIKSLDKAAKGLEYVEQPCVTVEELARVRQRVDVRIAADESVRRAADPLRVARAGAADLLVIKMQPLGGVYQALQVCEQAGLPVVVSSALDSAVGIWGAARLAAALPELPFACGLATGSLLLGDTCLPVSHPRGVVTVDNPVFDLGSVKEKPESEVEVDLLHRWVNRLGLMCQQMEE